jgi:benzylsuccinate CoA-transferase BbsF subunit
VRVLDFTWMVAGPLGTRLLATFGADVIKIESYNRVDRMRETGPHPDAPWSLNEDGSFNDVNLGKRTILLNLGYPEGQAIAKRLAAVSDVTAANFTGNRLDRWGLGFDDLARVQPNLIFLNMPVFESSGERQRWTGIGSHINALAGINGISGFADEPPFGLGPLYPDFSGNPFHLTAAILAALLDRDRGAGAQFIEVSQYESTASLLGTALLRQVVAGEAPARTGNHSDRACPHSVYPCQGTPWAGATVQRSGPGAGPPPSPGPDDDRWCAIEVHSDEEWGALCRALGREEWLRDPRFATFGSRKSHEDALDALIAAETRGRTAEDLAARLQSVGVAAAPVNRIDHVLADPWYRAEYFSELPGPEGCLFTTHGEPIRPFGRKQPVARAPMLGEHTEVVLGELLGMARGEVDELYARGVLG